MQAEDDELSCAILTKEKDILNGSVTLHFNRNCRSTFTSAQHIKHLEKRRPTKTSPSADQECLSMPVLRRSQTSSKTFSWKENCFICGKSCHLKLVHHWSLVESAIDSKSLNTYTKVLQAARERMDYEMQIRLHGVLHGDLVAIEARYHRTPACLEICTC